tara:strand:- start:233 stop:745 length:513 start_codon:yes stop_codon:yes gene_type:complete
VEKELPLYTDTIVSIIKSKMTKIFFLFLFFSGYSMLTAQIENQTRDKSPGLFKNQRLFHSPPKPLFRGRKHNLDFVTTIPQDSIISGSLFFKTNLMDYYREFNLNSKHGLFRFTYNPEIFPGTHLKYYFVMKTTTGIHAAPIDDNGKLAPINKLLIDPIQYYKQQSRLNK